MDCGFGVITAHGALGGTLSIEEKRESFTTRVFGDKGVG